MSIPAHSTYDLWPDGYVRLFLSHSAVHKAFATEVSAVLLPLGVSGFVAHDSMVTSRPWQDQIEVALTTAEALAVLLHPEANDSAWCQQEIGWALGRGLPYFVVRLGADPHGFPGGTQWPSAFDKPAADVASLIARWLNSQESMGDRMAGGMLSALRAASSYRDAEIAGKALDAFGELTPEQWTTLDEIFVANSQVGRSILARRALQPLYWRAGRSFPDS